MERNDYQNDVPGMMFNYHKVEPWYVRLYETVVYSEFFELMKIGFYVCIAITIALSGILGCVYLVEKQSCDSMREELGMDTRMIAIGGCYVKYKGRYIPNCAYQKAVSNDFRVEIGR